MIRLTLYNGREATELLHLLVKFQQEVYKTNTNIQFEEFIESHYAIYLVWKDKECIGFSSFVHNSYYGLREATIGNDYIFIDKGYRRSRAMHLISIQAAKVCESLDCPLEHYIADGSGSEKFVGRLDGKKIYTTFEYSVDAVKQELLKLQRKVRITI